MLISKTMSAIFNKKTFFFFFLVLILIFPTTKVQALVTIVSAPTGPGDNTEVLGPFNFSFTFKVTKGPGENDSDPVTLAFSVKINDATAKVAGKNLVQVPILYPFNETLGNARAMTQPITRPWQDMLPRGPDATKYTWTLYDPYDSTIIYATKSFTLKSSPTAAGWYFIRKSKSTTEYFYSVSDPYSTQALCESGMEADKNSPAAGISYEACKQYDSKPFAPPNSPAGSTDTTYTLLAPLPGIDKTIDTKPSDTNPCPLGKYLNVMITLFFGICGVLAVIMVVMGGIQYMTSDLVSSKEEGKNTILHAIMGLLLALGAWLILNTINPNLLNVCLNSLPVAEITIDEDVETPASAQPAGGSCPVGTKTPMCQEGIVEVKATNGAKFCLCYKIANNIKTMVDLNSQLSGGSFRTKQRQEELRSQNCGGASNIYNPKAKCTPLTAIPGKSRHENGLAVDFRCTEGPNTNLIQNETNACFVWLKGHAKTYGLVNLKTGTEPWHWSTDGK